MTRAANRAYHNKYSDAAKAVPKITVYFLQASRCIRTVWLLEELGIPYALEFADRVNQRAPQEFKEKSGNRLGKFPTVRDGELVIHESGAITEYLCDKYDAGDRLIPADDWLRARAQMFIHAAESTLMLHALSVLYCRWNFPESLKQSNPDALEQMEAGMARNVHNAFDWLEGELDRSTGRFLVGDQVTAADIMMQFSARFILTRELGTKGKSWPKVEEWLERCENTDTYKKAVEKSGHTLFPKTI